MKSPGVDMESSGDEFSSPVGASRRCASAKDSTELPGGELIIISISKSSVKK